MRKDVNELKKLVLESLANPDQVARIIKENASLFESIGNEEKEPSNELVLNINPTRNKEQLESPDEVQDISHVTEDDSLSIEKKEKELIIRALRKNNDKRKYAARDLGISERTLYRKIKEYGLEE